MRRESRFTVIIPTLQRSPLLRSLVEQCAAHPAVLEVLVVNNAPEPLAWEHPAVRVLQQEENIFVNPAWNLGAREARGDLLAIINDDIEFEDAALEHARRALSWGVFGIVGPSEESFNRPPHGRRGVRIAPFFSFKQRFGTFMCMRATDYVPIPEVMRIWEGDDWLLLLQKRPNAVLTGYRFATDMSVTSGSPEFQARREAELAVNRQIVMPLYRVRWWHRPVEYLDRARGSIARARAGRPSRDTAIREEGR